MFYPTFTVFYSLNLTLYLNKMSHISFPKALTLQQLYLFLIRLQIDPLDAVEKLWLKGTFIPFTPGQIQFFTSVLYFLMLPSFGAL